MYEILHHDPYGKCDGVVAYATRYPVKGSADWHNIMLLPKTFERPILGTRVMCPVCGRDVFITLPPYSWPLRVGRYISLTEAKTGGPATV